MVILNVLLFMVAVFVVSACAAQCCACALHDYRAEKRARKARHIMHVLRQRGL